METLIHPTKYTIWIALVVQILKKLNKKWSKEYHAQTLIKSGNYTLAGNQNLC